MPARLAAEEQSEVFVVCAQIEQEIAELEDEERVMFLEELGLQESGLDKLIRASYHLLGLISFLTSGEDETRAWTIKKGTKAPQAAGKIHTDFERGFIRAEVVAYEDLIAVESVVCKKVAAEKKIKELKEELTKQSKVINAILERLENPYEKLVMQMRYEDGLEWDEIRGKIFGSRKDYDGNIEKYNNKVFKIHGAALKHIKELQSEKNKK